MSTTTASLPATTTAPAQDGVGSAQTATGISLVAFLSALATSLVVFGVQISLFLLLRNKLARILYVSPISHVVTSPRMHH
jgi:hypothetical protein